LEASNARASWTPQKAHIKLLTWMAIKVPLSEIGIRQRNGVCYTLPAAQAMVTALIAEGNQVGVGSKVGLLVQVVLIKPHFMPNQGTN
jgi:hypothetical protein